MLQDSHLLRVFCIYSGYIPVENARAEFFFWGDVQGEVQT